MVIEKHTGKPSYVKTVPEFHKQSKSLPEKTPKPRKDFKKNELRNRLNYNDVKCRDFQLCWDSESAD